MKKYAISFDDIEVKVLECETNGWSTWDVNDPEGCDTREYGACLFDDFLSAKNELIRRCTVDEIVVSDQLEAARQNLKKAMELNEV